MNLQPGTRLGKYDLIRRIAVGGMAELYLASTTGLEGFEKLVALKRILPHYAEAGEALDMFLQEARLAASLNHQNIVQVNDVGVEDGCYFIVMEYVHGVDLQKLLRAGRRERKLMPLECALTVVREIAAGLHYAHDKSGPDGKPLGLVHRDVSPHNVIVSYDGSVKLADFGIAKATNLSKQSTSTGSLKGKLAYMSPEQCIGKVKLDRRCDVFALGIILWELTTGTRLFGEDNSYELIRMIADRDAPSPRTVVPDYPAALEAITLRALARDRDQRFQTAQDVQHALEDFAHGYRLRLSSAVVTRYIEEIFGRKLDEWRTAREQGMYFVEEHVVKTLDGLQDLRGTQQVLLMDALEEDPTDIEELEGFAGQPPAGAFQALPQSYNLATVSLPDHISGVQESRIPRQAEPTWKVNTLVEDRKPRPRYHLWVAVTVGLVCGIVVSFILWTRDADRSAAEPSAPLPSAGNTMPDTRPASAAGGNPRADSTEATATTRSAEAEAASTPDTDDAESQAEDEDSQADDAESQAEDEDSQADDAESQAEAAGQPDRASKPKSKKRRKRPRRSRDSTIDNTKDKKWDPNSPFMPDS